MRDTNTGMIQLIETSDQGNAYSSLIAFKIEAELVKIRFAISQADYYRLKRIMEFRPFEDTGTAPYKYFFPLSYRKDSSADDLGFLSVRVEQANRSKQYELRLSRKYISNILWFSQMRDKSLLKDLIEE